MVGNSSPHDRAQEASTLSEHGAARRAMLQATAAIASGGIAMHSSEAAAPLPTSGPIMDRLGSGPSIHKQRGLEDYRANMKPFGGSLASPIGNLLQAPETNGPYQFEFLVIGSGYGGSVCAARLAQALKPGYRLALLERGKEWITGTFPDNRAAAAEEARFNMFSPVKNKLQNPIGLFNCVKFDDVNVLAGAGLGGGSLINANVAYRPEEAAFACGRWPQVLTDRAQLDPYYDRAASELGVATEPIDGTPKMIVQRKAAARLAASGANFAPAQLTVVRGDGAGPITNRQGIRQRPCTNCGDCTAGCNVGAKRSLAMNYLPLARKNGAEIFTQCDVIHLEKCDGFYRVHFKHYHDCVYDRMRHTVGSVTAKSVIVGAGSLGSTELLLRSQCDGLTCSPKLGHQWSANGDAIGFIRKIEQLTNIGGFGAYPSDGPPVGPTIQTNLTFPHREDIRHRVLIQDGAVARAYSNILGTVLGDVDLKSTMLLFAMGFDDGVGRISLDNNGNATIRWPGLRDSAYRRMIQREFERVADAMGGSYRVLRAFGDSLVTVHPLGGCNLADDPLHGVTNDRGEVFDPTMSGAMGGPGVHEGLYVADGSVVPSAVGVNPFMTIAALSERIAEHITLDPRYSDMFA